MINQVSISTAGVYSGSPARIFHRAGDGSTDYHTMYRTTFNCTAHCQSVMTAGGLGGLHSGGDPHYAKCYDSVTPAPLNGIRVAFPSQLNTWGIDPALPQITPITNVSACLRMISLWISFFLLTFVTFPQGARIFFGRILSATEWKVKLKNQISMPKKI